MGNTLYELAEDGGIKFRSQRKGHFVMIPNYILDIWMPLIGAKAIGVYIMYARLERCGVVKALTQADLASGLRIGTRALQNINEILAECGFIEINKPTGYKITMHYTTEIVVKDAPKEIPSELINKYEQKGGYSPIANWLIGKNEEGIDESEFPNGNTGDAKWKHGEFPNGNANVESLDIESLELKDSSASPSLLSKEEYAKSKEEHKEYLEGLRKRHPEVALFGINEKRKGVLANLYEYPSDIQDIIKSFCIHWKKVPPPKGSGMYGKWIKDAREIKKGLQNSHLSADEVFDEAYYAWKTPPPNVSRKQYDGSFTVVDLGSVAKIAWDAVGSLLMGNSKRKVKVYYGANGKKVER